MFAEKMSCFSFLDHHGLDCLQHLSWIDAMADGIGVARVRSLNGKDLEQ